MTDTMPATPDPPAEDHATVRFSGAEWGALDKEEQGRVLGCASELALTGCSVARRLRERARQRLRRGARPRGTGGVVLRWASPDARGTVSTPE